MSNNNNNKCRSCLQKHDSTAINVHSIFKTHKYFNLINIKLSTVINYCTNIEVDEDDELPNKICEKCLLSLLKAFEFKQQFIRANKLLLNNIKKLETESKLNFENVFIKQEEMFDQFHIVNICNTTTSIQQQTVKHEEILKDEIKNVDIENIKKEVDLPSTQSKNVPLLRKFKTRLLKKNQIQKCEICLKILSTPNALKTHMQIHSEVDTFLCSECGEKFKTKASYDGHLTTHNVNNPNKCNLCGKSYRQKRTLRDHIRSIHLGEKSFLCGICGKGMTQKSGFKKHMLTHSGEKPYPCNICGKFFRYSSTLILHKRIHTGEKPYKCSECDLSFIEKSQLKRHTLVHTNEKPFECDICRKSFNRRTNLRVHMRIHTGEKRYFCEICGKGYIQNHCLKTHMLTHRK